jgi:endonuclease/exonuclease/phosphatase family metal-dependent hydrolase
MLRPALIAPLFLGLSLATAACSDDSTPGADAGPRDLPADRALPDAPGEAGSPASPPAIDGLFEDWQGIAALAADAAGDATGGFDVTTVKVATRGTVVYLYFDVGKLLNAPSGPAAEGTLRLELTPASGSKLAVDLRGRKALTDGDKALRWKEIGYVLAPTHASDRFEGRIDLAAVGGRPGDVVTLELSGSDALDAPASFRLTGAPHTPSTREAGRAAGTAFRVASLNTLYDGLTDGQRGPRLGRLLKAAAADIYCFQEVFTAPAAAIASALTTLDPRGDSATWTAHKVADALVATRGSLKPVPLQSLSQQYAGAAVDVDGRSVVVFTLRPPCCGYIGDPSDAQRIAELKALAAAIAKLRQGQLGADLLPYQKAPVVVVGDWNLVGSRTPLDVMLDKSSGPGLAHLLLRHLRGDDVFTWYQDELDAFPPGMLDVLVHSPDLTPRRSFVLDTAELGDATLAKLGLQPDDSQASDHLMLVADF